MQRAPLIPFFAPLVPNFLSIAAQIAKLTNMKRVWIVLAVATVLGVAGTFQYGEKPVDSIGYWYLWGAFLPFIVQLVKRFPFHSGTRLKHFFIYILAGVGIVTIQAAIHTICVEWLLHPQPPRKLFDSRFGSDWFDGFYIYSTIVILSVALDLYRRAQQTKLQSAQTENRILRAQIESLKLQFDPQFIYRSLNQVSNLTDSKVDDADSLIAYLGDYLRISLNHAEISEVSLQQEFQLVESYLQIENAISRNFTLVDWEIDNEAWGCQIPGFLLQATIEDLIHANPGMALKITIIGEKTKSACLLNVFIPGLNKHLEFTRLDRLMKRLNALYTPSVLKQLDVKEHSIQFEIPLALEWQDNDAVIESNVPEDPPNDEQPASSSISVDRWCALIGIFTFLAVYFCAQNVFFQISFRRPINWPLELLHVSCWYIWALLIPLIVRFSSRYPLQQPHLLRNLAIHAIGFLCAWSVVAAAHAGIKWASYAGLVTYASQFRMFVYFGVYFVCFSTIIAAENAARYHRYFERGMLRTVRLNAEFARARLNALRMQLQPHFLFNALNSLSQLIREDSAAAKEMISNLENFMHMTWNSCESHVISLKEEMEYLKSYLCIENVRFQDRLKVKIEVDPETLRSSIPNLILQPIVENAIKHGIAPRLTAGEVEIKATTNAGLLKVSVRDDGPGLRKSKQQTSSARFGVGLSNTRERLMQLYGTNHRFEMINAPEGGLLVSLEIPAKIFAPLR